jgi:hypothetical protein
MSNIAIRGSKDPHSYHVLGTDMIKWVAKGIPTKDAKAKELQGLIRVVEQGISNHPNSEPLRILHSNLQDEYLSLAVAR